MLATALQFSHQLLEEAVTTGDTVIDATVGNGHDTVFLSKLVGDSGTVFGFDIQAQAIQKTKDRLIEANLQKNVTLFCQGHETLEDQLDPQQEITAAVFNLGYLPSSDKTIITHPKTTLSAVSAILRRLTRKGRIILVVYYGHSGGEEEKEAIYSFCQKLPQEQFSVMTYQFINQKNCPPVLFAIERK